MGERLLEVDGLTCGYGEAVVLSNVGFALDAGRSLALLGRNGTGKTTLIDTLVGVTRRHAGRITLAGRPLHTLAAHERASAGVGWVPQERNIFKSLTVHENLTAVERPGKWNPQRVYEMFPRLAERNRAAKAAGDADDRIDQRGLAGAVAPEQRQRLAFAQRQRHVRQHHRLAVAGAQGIDGEKLRHRPPHRDRPP